MTPDVAFVGNADSVGRINLELAVLWCLPRPRRASRHTVRTALVTGLGQDACKASESHDPVLGNLLRLISQAAGELAVAQTQPLLDQACRISPH